MMKTMEQAINGDTSVEAGIVYASNRLWHNSIFSIYLYDVIVTFKITQLILCGIREVLLKEFNLMMLLPIVILIALSDIFKELAIKKPLLIRHKLSLGEDHFNNVEKAVYIFYILFNTFVTVSAPVLLECNGALYVYIVFATIFVDVAYTAICFIMKECYIGPRLFEYRIYPADYKHAIGDGISNKDGITIITKDEELKVNLAEQRFFIITNNDIVLSSDMNSLYLDGKEKVQSIKKEDVICINIKKLNGTEDNYVYSQENNKWELQLAES